ncbi:MAG: SAM-dependent DNA methyltransferase [Chloroflexi bacterium]|nr:SAM-dependent DNA methyltransferase [Chloroflexota bacterium]
MQPLERSLRRDLERTIQQAREVAEAAAKTAINQVGVVEAKPYDYLSESQRDLRRRLRAHGRQLGDERKGTGEQATDRLCEEVAYEHWHRMLFARFLAENNLLMYPDPHHPVPVTLQECDELAEGEGARNGWELAARFASQMLPQIFRQDSPVLELVLPPENQQKLEGLLADLPSETFIAADALGWVYQFWQAKKKDEVNKSEVKIGARELPAVTQLFTEPYMVSFLLDNALGAWWGARRLTSEDLQDAQSEAELRQKAAIPGVTLEYLRFVRDEESGAWTPAAGTFDAWPEHLSDLKVLDPCCGSGHFLVSALLMLAPMRAELEGLTPREACDAVLRDNLHGLEIDQRCVEIAAFALALTAWRFAGYRDLPELHLACSGVSVKAARSEWRSLVSGNARLEFGLNRLYELFEDAPVLGSLINPARAGTDFIASWDELRNAFDAALAREPEGERHTAGVVAQGMVKAASLLAAKYHWVITNVPYLGIGAQDDTLRAHLESYYFNGRHDLATAFLERVLDFVHETCVVSVVVPQNWLYLKRYTAYRKHLLTNHTLRQVAKLGSGAFETITGEVVKVILAAILRGESASETVFSTDQTGRERLWGLDVSSSSSASDKSAALLNELGSLTASRDNLKNPDSRIEFETNSGRAYLSDYASALSGISTGELNRFVRQFWEIQLLQPDWEYVQSTVASTEHYGGCSDVIFWEQERGQLYAYAQSMRHTNHAVQNWLRGKPNWGKPGVCVTKTGQIRASKYTGNIYSENCCALIPLNTHHLSALWCYCSSPEYHAAVRAINQSLLVQTKYLIKVPFDLQRWQKVAEEQYPHGLPKPYSDDPTQWIFHGHPCGSVVWNETTKWTDHGPLRTDSTVLQVAVARLLGYRWPAELDKDMELADEQRAWVAKSVDLLPYADLDGIVCIPAVRGERPATDRLLNLLAAAYGDAWSTDVLAQLLASADHAGKSLETWLRDKFFSQHCALFSQRPFIWHIWDGLRDGFSALVNYHKLDYKLLETVIYNYLGDWIARQKQDVAQGVDGAQEKLAAAETLQKRLILILHGEEPHDIFVRWKPLHEQPIGWNPDLNDGVRLNIRPFMSVPDIGKKGAGVLRDKPRIEWGKDRGKDVSTAPWYHVHNGDRINDHHLTLAEKQAAKQSSRIV